MSITEKENYEYKAMFIVVEDMEMWTERGQVWMINKNGRK